VDFRLPKGAGQQAAGLIEAYRYGLFAPGKSRIVIDTKGRYAWRRGDGAPAGLDGGAAQLDLTPTDRASFLGKLPPPAPRPKETRGQREPEEIAPKPNAKPVIVIDAGHGGVDPGAQAESDREGRSAGGRPPSAYHPGSEGAL
jgi:N-acetylmuramoyl-L-alanine amidase